MIYVIWFSLQLLSDTFFILRKTERDVIIPVHTFTCRVAVILVRFNDNCILSTYFRKILKYQISRKSVHW
jgi:hypothetical protein